MSKSRMDLQTARDWSEVNRSFARTKTIVAQIKRSPTDGSGRFVALVSTFHREPDVMGDVVDRHAFDRTINEAYAKHPKNLWPVWWMHQYENPSAAIGVITAAVVTDEGLVVEGRLAVDSNEKAMEVYRGMLEDRIREWSISYGVIREHKEKWDDGQTVNVLDELELLEISSVMAGANRYTRTLQVKAEPVAKAGTKVVTCPGCRTRRSVKVQDSVPGGVVPWAATSCCGKLVGWSGSMSTEQHVREMALVRERFDAARAPRTVDPELVGYKAQLDAILKERIPMPNDHDLIAQLDALDPDGAKHTPRQATAASTSCLDGAATALAVRDRVTFPSLTNRLLDIAVALRGFADRLAGGGIDLEVVAREAAQRGQAMCDVAAVLLAGGHADEAGDLERAGDRIISTCTPLAERQLAPPAAVEIVGPKAIPAFTARFAEIDDDPAPAVTGETYTVEQGAVEPTTFRIEKE